MKIKLLVLTFLMINLIGFSQTTAIPDVNFETYLETHSNNGTYQYTGTVVPIGDPNSMGDGAIDGFVPTSQINTITELDVSSVGNISDLTGIEGFAALESLICEANQLTALDVSLNTALTSLFCNANQLTSLNVQNGNNANLWMMSTNNPNLSCIQVDDDTAAYLSSWSVDSGASFSMSCSEISGIVSYDCTSLTPQQNVQVKATAATSGNIYFTTTNSNGEYSFSLNETGTVTTEVVAQNIISSPVNYVYVYNGQSILGQDFCIDSVTTGDDVHVTIVPITPAPIPGFSSTYQICFGNYGSTTVSGDVHLTYDDTKVGSPTSPSVFTQNASTLTWSYSNLLPFEVRCIEVVFTVNPAQGANAVVAGDYLIYTVTIDPTVGDQYPIDNFYEIEEMVVNAYDPNDMTIFEGPYIQPSQSTDYLNFRIRFQNTGTAFATNINVKTVLDANIDMSSFQLISGSHVYSTSIVNSNEVTFSFDNINLDYESNNEPDSHGWITFKAKPVAGFAIGDVISAYADIFFDTNPAIVTNTATVQIAPPTLTYVPDSNFEIALIDLGYDSGPLDNYVLTTNINTVDYLSIPTKNIADLTGIEDFVALEELYCVDNLLTSIDLSQNIVLKYFHVDLNQLTSLDVTNNTLLIEFSCSYNQLSSVDISQNSVLYDYSCSHNQITTLETAQNPFLENLALTNNLVTNLDVSSNTLLDLLYVENNNLVTLNVKNANNSNFVKFLATNNPNLLCIEVDDDSGTYLSSWFKDSTAIYSTDCAAALSTDTHLLDISALVYPNPVNNEVTISIQTPEAIFSIINNNGQILKQGELLNGDTIVDVSKLVSGFYILKIKSKTTTEVRKLLVQ